MLHQPLIGCLGFIILLDNSRPLTPLAHQMHTGRKVIENQIRVVIEAVEQPYKACIVKSHVPEMLPHHTPVAFLDAGIVILFVGARTRHGTGAVGIGEEVLHVIIDELRPVVCVEAAHAEGQLAEQVFESVAGDVLPLVPYGSILRPVGKFVRESQSPNKASGEIALAVSHRVNAQSTGLFGTPAAINIGNGLFELSQALLPRLFSQRLVCHAVRGQSPLKSRG